MRTKRGLKGLVGIGAVVALVACGGGGPDVAGIDGTGITPPSPGTSPAVAIGTVTAFGSVFVDGIRFDTSSATFTIDGLAGSQDDLAVGDVVTVTGSIDKQDPTRGTATTVVFDDAVQGPLQSKDASAGTLIVLGQSVRVSATTSFEAAIQPPSIDGLSLGQILEVTGLIRSDGTIDATRIELRPASTEWEATGRVSAHDAGQLTFMLNGLSVDYSSALVESFPRGSITDGDLVEIKGSPALGSTGELIASVVELKGGPAVGAAGDRMEVEGFITRFADATDFDVGGIPVTTTNQTTFDDSSPADLGIDVQIEVEGEVDAAGVLVAFKVEARSARSVRLFGAVDSTSPAIGGTVGTGSFVVFGIPIDVDALTRREDQRDDISPFGVAQLAVGDWVEVRGTESPPGSARLLAGLVEREEDGQIDESELRGFVTAAASQELTILGVTITTDASTSFHDVDGNPISASQFFADVAVAGSGSPASLVEARGIETAPRSIAATEVGFEE